MKKNTPIIKQKMLSLDNSFERLQQLKNQYKDQTVYIIGTGPSLKNYNLIKLKNFLKDKFVIGIKQSYDILEDVIDIHLLNFCNYTPIKYNKIKNTIISWIAFTPNHPYDIINNNIPCDFMLPLYRNNGDYYNTIAGKKDFENLLIENSFDRPWGPGILYESGIPLALYCGCKKIITLGWDIGSINPDDYKNNKSPHSHFYKSELINNKTKDNIGYEEATIVVNSTEDLYKFLQNINVELNIVSDINPAHKSIPRIEIPEIQNNLLNTL